MQKEIGTAYMQLGKLDRALDAFAEAERLDSRHSVRVLWETKAGIAALLADRDREAYEWLTKAAAVTADEPWILGLTAVAASRSGNQVEAVRSIAALKALPGVNGSKAALDGIDGVYAFSDPRLAQRLTRIVEDFGSLYDTKAWAGVPPN